MTEFFTWIGPNNRVISAVKNPKCLCLCDFSLKPDTPAAQNTALSIKHKVSTNVQRLRFQNFRALHLTLIFPNGHIVVLEPTLTRLIADRTVERVIDKMKLKSPFMGVFHLIGISFNVHALHRLQVTGNLQFGTSLYFNKTKATNAGDRKPWMPAKMRYRDFHLLSGLHYSSALRNRDCLTVYLKGNYLAHAEVPRLI